MRLGSRRLELLDRMMSLKMSVGIAEYGEKVTSGKEAGVSSPRDPEQGRV